MTPLQAAVETHVAFYATQPREPRSEASAKATAFAAMRASITAYLTALPEDAGTVEKVAAALDGNAWRDKTHGPLGKAQKAARRSTARQNARAALTALASRDERKE